MSHPGPSARRPRGPRKPPPPLDPASLDAVAIRYVERFQTTRARLVRLLATKLRQRGWSEGFPPPDLAAVADRMVAAGYIDDRAFAEARARGLQRRGMGEARIRAALSASGVDADDQQPALAAHDAAASAIAFARRKRLGPFGPVAPDAAMRQRQFAAMARAGHPPDLARAILNARSEAALAEFLSETGQSARPGDGWPD